MRSSQVRRHAPVWTYIRQYRFITSMLHSILRYFHFSLNCATPRKNKTMFSRYDRTETSSMNDCHRRDYDTYTRSSLPCTIYAIIDLTNRYSSRAKASVMVVTSDEPAHEVEKHKDSFLFWVARRSVMCWNTLHRLSTRGDANNEGEMSVRAKPRSRRRRWAAGNRSFGQSY
jgi:hypothetical protein